MYSRHRRRRFGSAPRRGPVSQSSLIARKRGKCRGCGLNFEQGETISVLRLRKSYRQPCSLCAHKLIGSKRFHPQCVPADIVKAMGFDPNASAHTHGAPPPPPPSGSSAHQVPPPPKPMSAADASLGALLAIENALKRRLAENPALKNDPALEKTMNTYNACKAHALRNTNDNEAKAGLKNALKRALDLVF